METLRQTRRKVDFKDTQEVAYYEWRKDSIEWILNDIVDSQATSVESIEKYLQDLLNK